MRFWGGGLSGRGPLGGSSAGGTTILGSRTSAGGSTATAYEDMDAYRGQVISLVRMEEVYFSTPVGTRGVGFVGYWSKICHYFPV